MGCGRKRDGIKRQGRWGEAERQMGLTSERDGFRVEGERLWENDGLGEEVKVRVEEARYE